MMSLYDDAMPIFIKNTLSAYDSDSEIDAVKREVLTSLIPEIKSIVMLSFHACQSIPQSHPGTELLTSCIALKAIEAAVNRTIDSLLSSGHLDL